MVKSLPTVNCNTFSNQGSSTGITYKKLMEEFEKQFQGVYYEVHVECSNPNVATIEPIVLKSIHNQPKQYLGPWSGKTKFEFQVEQFEKCKRVCELLLRKALVVQEKLSEEYKSMPEEYKVIVVERKL